MDTIRTYLDNMFLTLPQTPEAIRAKEELYSMMEDKYNELKEAGKSENEAIGTVIAEFGNLEELAESLNLKGNNTSYSYEDTYQDTVRTVSSDEADDFLQFSRKSAIRVALGVMLCVFSPVALIFLAGVSETSGGLFSENMAVLCGLLALFLLVAIAVALFISYGLQLKQYDYLKKETFRMDFATTSYVRELHSQFRIGFAVQITVGVVLCILSVVPLLVSALLFDANTMLVISCVCALLVIVGIATFLFVHAGMMYSSFHVLLQEGDYAPRRKEGPSATQTVLDAIAGFYWPIVTIIYLGSSFLLGNWHISWLIWIIAGVLSGPFYAFVGALKHKR